MAVDPTTPLLEDAEGETQTKLVSLEDTIEPYIDGFRWPQVLQAVVVSMACFFDAQQTFITIFTDAKPTWHCTEIGNTTCNSQSNICQLPASAWSWDKPARTSTVSEWFLQCTSSSSPVIEGLPASSFFVGCLLGGIILTLLGDSIGRKNLLTLSCLIMSTASIFAAFSANIWIYSVLRLLSGLGRAAIGSCVLVLSTECVGKHWRGTVGVIGFLCSTMGFLSLPAIAYMNRNYSWRALYLFTAIPAILYCMLIQFCVFESPRWLLQQGKLEESIGVLNTFMLPEDDDDDGRNSKLGFLNLSLHRKEKNQTLIGVLSTNGGGVLRRLIMAMAVGFGIGVIYYGMPLSLGNLEFNLYISTAINALVEIPSSLMILYLAKFARRDSLLALCITSGGCGVLCIFAGEWKVVEIGLEMISFFAACTAYSLLLIYIAELFPTNTRNSAVAMVWQSVMFSGVISPVVIAAGEVYNKMLPNFVFGLVILVLGLLVMFLPETMDEEEQKNNEEEPCFV